MLTTCRPIHHLVQLIGTRLVLVSLFGGLNLPTASVSGVEPTAYREYPDYRDYRDYRSYRRPRYEQPDHFTMHKGKKCELQCERIWGTRDYQCREHRC
jgi:hypothetical protein